LYLINFILINKNINLVTGNKIIGNIVIGFTRKTRNTGH